MKKNILNVAIVGFGHIGKLHLDTISQNQDLNAIALIDINICSIQSSLPVFSKIADCHHTFPDIDLYVIASPNGMHYKQAKEVLNLKKNVLVEKPITLHKKQVKELIAVANNNKVRLFSSLQLRYSPIIKYIKELFDKNYLGKIFLVNVDCFWNRNDDYYKKSYWHGTKDIDGGILFTQFSHFIDILHFFLGKLELISNQVANFSHQNQIEFPDSGILQFKSGEAIGNMSYTISTYKKNFESTICIIAEKGTIKIGGQYMNQLLYHNVEGIFPPEIQCLSNKFHNNLYEDIISSLKNNIPSVIDAENTVQMIGFIEQASAL